MKYFSLFLFASFLFVGCGAGSQTVITNHKFDDKDYRDNYMFIAPIANEVISISKTSEDAKRIKPEEKNSIKNILYKSIMSYTVGYVDGIKVNRSGIDSSLFLSQLDTTKYFCISKAIGRDTTLLKFYIPRKEILKQNNIKANVVAAINDISFLDGTSYSAGYYTPGTTVSTPGGSFTTPGHFSGGGSYPSRELGIRFIFFDYDANEIVTYGIARIKVPMAWEAAGRGLAEEFFKETPFTLKYTASKSYRNAQRSSAN